MDEKITIQTPWFFSGEDVLKKLGTSTSGLTETEAKKRLSQYGANDFKSKKKLSIAKLALKQIMSPLIFILIGAAILTSILGEWVNTGVIIAAVLINAGLGLYREYQAETTLEKLATYIKDRSRVIRDKHESETDSALLVPGDIIKLSYGSRVPADARILSVNNFKVDEAILTGESNPESKNSEIVKESTLMADRTNMVYAGTLVVEGFATAIVVETGKRTEIGKIADIVSSTERAPTPIQKGLSQLSWYIFGLTIFVVAAIFLLGVARGEPILEMLILSAAVAVGAVPEALPIVLTVILAAGAERIASKKGIIRKLVAAETLGSVTLVMTDKTGTLTKADMQLVGVDTYETLTKGKYTSTSLTHLTAEQKKTLELALENIDVIVQNPIAAEKDWKFIGHPFEINIARASIRHGISMQDSLAHKSSLYIPFNSSYKFSVSKKDSRYIIMGAPDVLLERSSMDKDTYLAISSWIQEASADGRRLIAVGTLHKDKDERIDVDSVKKISFSGILSFFDPVREEIPAAMKNIANHGVRTVIITGDLKGTAVSVAKSLGWEIKDEQILTGEEVQAMTDEQLLEVLNQIKIFARTTPEQKLRIGNLYRKQGEIVAMTGDGVNDAPALKSVDIGISLGSGTDVAQSAADLVLLDDNFQTISMAIDEGRRMMANIRKAFVYLMSNALDEVFIISGSLLAGLALPLTALQIIWVNLFTGSLPALAFAYDENLDKEISARKLKKELLTSEVKILSFGLGTATSVMLFILYYFMIKFGVMVDIARAVLFACFSIYMLVVAFSFRSLTRPIFTYNPFANRKLNIAIFIAFGVFLATMLLPFMRDIFKIAPMPLSYIWLIVVWSVANIILVEVTKWFFRLRLQHLKAKEKHPTGEK